MIIVTNNPDVKAKYENERVVEFVEGGYKDVLIRVRDLIFEGHELLTHPLMGSVKPNETPYRSIAVAKHAGKLNNDNVIMIADCITTYDKFAANARFDRGRHAPEWLLEDFRYIDLTLISSAVDYH